MQKIKPIKLMMGSTISSDSDYFLQMNELYTLSAR